MINILPYNEKKLIKRARTIRIITALVWGAILLVGITAILLVPTVLTINNRYTIVKKQLSLFEQSGVIPKAVDIQALDTRVGALYQTFVGGQVTPPPVYVGIIRTLAQGGITITSFAQSSTAATPTFQIQGVAATRGTLQSFITALKANDQIASVDAPISNFVKSTESIFTITIVFKK